MSRSDETHIYDSLLNLPLFLGMSRGDIESIVESTKIHFKKYASRKVIVREGEPCIALHFLLKGHVCAVTESAGHAYTFEERLSAPNMLQPERMFGLVQRYTSTFVSCEGCDLLTLDKKAVVRLADNYSIFRINLMNVMSTSSQKLSSRFWRKAPGDTVGRIVHFIENRSLRPAGMKTLRITMETLAAQINDSRRDVSAALNVLADGGLIELKRGIIVVPRLERLIADCRSHSILPVR